MTLTIKKILIIIGLTSAGVSFLLFGRHHDLWSTLFFGGLILALIFYLSLLLTKQTVKTKVMWTLIVLSILAIQWIGAPLLIKKSYLIYVNRHYNELTEVNNILQNKAGDFEITFNEINDSNESLTKNQKDRLLQLRNLLKVWGIKKSESYIYYGLWGLQEDGSSDHRYGLSYWLKNEKPGIEYQHLKDKWYY